MKLATLSPVCSRKKRIVLSVFPDTPRIGDRHDDADVYCKRFFEPLARERNAIFIGIVAGARRGLGGSLCGKTKCGNSLVPRETKLHCLLNELTCRGTDLCAVFVIHISAPWLPCLKGLAINRDNCLGAVAADRHIANIAVVHQQKKRPD
ncbi:hypothetical protein E1N52_41935 [Paraburkholderia guartelaensis]|uniref:Uncharacterized protein n=1 Tax=Paraburkholderia guartelaensis TaxID=2546446 RepID=A0A4V2ZUU5_9BURK|nr:hypothetical protein [Paraburkholderia guartelaensis]TDG02019.1 hypothetical protein E1N52_41935 [Paraburkholderia guartelaensis]